MEALGSISLYESYGAKRFGGNLAGVVVSDAQLADDVMLGIASDLLAPTTGFVNRAGLSADACTVRFFTPTQEIDACGHVSVAVATDLVLTGLWSDGEHVLRCAGGDFLLECDPTMVSMTQQRRYENRSAVSSLSEVAAILGCAPERMVVAGTGLRHLLVEFADVNDLGNIRLDRAELAQLARKEGVDTIGLYSLIGADRLRLRDITAPIGVLEEPASGTTSGALGLYLDRGSVIVEQGVEMGRPSELRVTPNGDSVSVAGSARRVFTGLLDA